MNQQIDDTAGQAIIDGLKTSVAANWFDGSVGRIVGTFGSLTAYIGAVGLFYQQFRTLTNDIPAPLVWAVLALPVVGVVLFSVLPYISERRKKLRTVEDGVNPAASQSNFRIRPYLTRDAALFVRDDGASERIGEWFQNATETLLHVSGVSGVGKTSLINSVLIPQLAASGWQVRPARILNIDSVLDEIDNATGTQKIAVVVDQFEEYFYARAADENKRIIEKIKSNHGRAGECRIILVWRSDYQARIFDDTEIPQPTNDGNWFQLAAYSQVAAIKFLRRNLPALVDDQLSSILSGLDRIEGMTNNYRLITLNMAGLIISDYAFRIDQNLSKLIQNYLLRTIRLSPMVNELRRILASLITTTGGRLQLADTAIASATGLPLSQVRAGLVELESKGVVRRVDAASGAWEVAHDFVAQILAQIVLSIRPTLLRRTQIVAPPAILLLVAVAIALGLPQYLKSRHESAVAALLRLGTVLSDDETVATVGEVSSADDGGSPEGGDLSARTSLAALRPIDTVKEVRVARTPTGADLTIVDMFPNVETSSIQAAVDNDNVGSLVELLSYDTVRSTLTSLTISTSDRDAPFDLSILNGLDKLQELSISDVSSINEGNYTGISLPSLKDLNLDGVRIDNLYFLRNSPNLGNVRLATTAEIKNLSFLPPKCQVETLSLTLAAQLEDASALKACAGLKELVLPDASLLVSLDFLENATQLEKLDLPWSGVKDLGPLSALPKLSEIDLSGVPGLGRLRPGVLPADLHTFVARFPPSAFNPGVLSRQTELTTLDLHGAEGLRDFAPLAGLRKLQKLDIGGTELRGTLALSTLDELQELDIDDLAHEVVLAGADSLGGLRKINIDQSASVRGRDELGPEVEIVGQRSGRIEYVGIVEGIPTYIARREPSR